MNVKALLVSTENVWIIRGVSAVPVVRDGMEFCVTVRENYYLSRITSIYIIQHLITYHTALHHITSPHITCHHSTSHHATVQFTTGHRLSHDSV